jgi:hypothetical protein
MPGLKSIKRKKNSTRITGFPELLHLRNVVSVSHGTSGPYLVYISLCHQAFVVEKLGQKREFLK